MKSDIFKGSQTLAHLYEEADSAFRHLPEQSESIRALTQAQERWKACLPPDISELTHASQHFNSQLESIRKLADDQLGVHQSALVAFQNSLKAATALPPNLLALAQASEKFQSPFEAISKKLAEDRGFFARYTEETMGASLESIGKQIQEDMILATAHPDLQWAAPVATDAEIREALTLQKVDVYTPALTMPSVQLRQKRLAPISEEFWLGIDADVTAVSRDLFEDGHFAQAVFEAVKRFDNEVRERSTSCGKNALFGVALMKEVFSPERPVISVAECSTTTGQNIQKGMMYLSMGLMSRIRNPLGHENLTMPLVEAKVWIGLVSQLMQDLKRAPLW